MSTISSVGLVAKHNLDAAAGVLAELAGWLEARGVAPVFETETAALSGLPPERPTSTRDALPASCDLIVVLGGDGTLIGMANRIAQAGVDVPILGVNFGSLGFLTEITLPELYESLDHVLDGTADMDRRMMLHARTLRDEAIFTERIVLNDVVITKGALSRIIELAVTVGEQPVMRVRADGLIVASPTGSTAYNLAAGGPIVHPSLDAVLLTPIAPHTLTNRPVIIPASSTVRVEPLMDNAHDEVVVTYDGQTGHPLRADDAVEIVRAERSLRVVRSSRRTYFDVLRQKLKWGER
ncbi:MAG TPA: NAD(+)/NADH kinase [Vicinamibacterales bacterium]|jgi:NAD+ kinase|nr:NAD(+)/NADH kinase [Vicinamibacterales bacterium]